MNSFGKWDYITSSSDLLRSFKFRAAKIAPKSARAAASTVTATVTIRSLGEVSFSATNASRCLVITRTMSSESSSVIRYCAACVISALRRKARGRVSDRSISPTMMRNENTTSVSARTKHFSLREKLRLRTATAVELKTAAIHKIRNEGLL